MDEGLAPWEIHPGLSSHRLQNLAELAARVRLEALDAHEEDKGDTAWGLGCRAHERTCYALKSLAERDDISWLQVVEPGLHFVFAIEGIPFRFYRGDHDRPPSRSLQRNYPEIEAHHRQTSLRFGDENDVRYDPSWYWRMAIETDAAGEVLRVVFLQVNDAGAIRNPWIVEIGGMVPYVAEIDATAKPGRDLPPPPIGSPGAGSDSRESSMSHDNDDPDDGDDN